ncbi:MAG: phage capsid protein [Pseudomonadota bacterium]|nr:phage capsid protein [Pseudomonadota bacterium]
MSFDQLVEAHHQLGMSNAVELALQRLGPKLRPYVTEKPCIGEAVPASDLLGTVKARRGQGRRRSNIENPVPKTRRWLEYRDPIETGQYLDKEDKFRSAMEPQSEIIQAHANAIGRAIDDLILGLDDDGNLSVGGILGSAVEGKRLSSTSTLGAEFKTVHGGTGLSIAKLRKARKKLGLSENDLALYTPVCAITTTQMDDLLGIVETASANLNMLEQPHIVDGKVKRLLGFDFVEHNGLYKTGTTRCCPVWLKNNIVLGVWQDVQTRAWNDTAARNTPYVHIDAYMDCVRKQDAGVHVIECTEA